MKVATPSVSASSGSLLGTEVYEAAEDTFLFMDGLQKDLSDDQTIGLSCAVEIGCGSGVLSAFLLKLCGEHRKRNQCSTPPPLPFVIGVDISAAAAAVASATALENSVGHQVDTVNADIFSCFKTLKFCDLILFNPPYLPSDSVPSQGIDRAWAGGRRGTEVIERFISQLTEEKLSPRCLIYLLLEQRNAPAEIVRQLYCQGLSGRKVMERRTLHERLELWRFKVRGSSE